MTRPSQVPEIARHKGYYHEVKAGQRYFWCSCGRSAKQPFCDGSHAGTAFTPVLFECRADEDVIFCGCKRTCTAPFCDGAHNNLPGGAGEDDPDSPANRAIAGVPHGAHAQVPLDGGCYVFSTKRASLARHGNLEYCRVIGPATGARFQSQFYAEIASGVSPAIASGGRHTVLFVLEGRGSVEISGRRFEIAPRMGLYVRPEEVFRVHNAASDAVKLFISNHPVRTI
jgi:CDGSH-type Zn-finger protein/mannose-6-phosphate isomerase-like protein (cupin superfamily)